MTTFDLGAVYQAGENIKGARTRNALFQGQTDRINAENALLGNPNTTPEQFIRGGRPDIANSLTNQRQFSEAQRRDNTSWLLGGVRQLKQSPMAIPALLEEAKARGIDISLPPGGVIAPGVLDELEQNLLVALGDDPMAQQQDYGFTNVNGALVRTNAQTGEAQPVYQAPTDPNQVSPREKFEHDQEQLRLQRDIEGRQVTKLSPALEKELLEATDLAFKSGNQAQELLVLADEYERNPSMLSGAAGGAWEALKQSLGSEDSISLLRRRYAAVRNSLVINNLPPGVASDRDIQIAMEGFLPPTANPEQVASFLRGMGKLERLNAQFNEFKANYIESERKAGGLLDAWKGEVSKQANQDAPEKSGPPRSSGPARVTSDEEYDALPSGTPFVGPDGVTRTKP